MKIILNKDMKNKLVVAVLCAPFLLQTVANAMNVDVVGNTIAVAVSNGSSVSRAVAEGEEQIVENGSVSFLVNEHVVVRSEISKSSFSPLKNSDGIGDVSATINKLIGFDMPVSFAEAMTLYQSFYTKDGETKRDCKVLVLDRLLDTTNRLKLRSLLDAKNMAIEERREFFYFECGIGE